jgi:nickel-dependent lactate racemase
MLLYERGSATEDLGPDDLREGMRVALDQLGPRQRVVAVPPDITRLHSRAGDLTCIAREYYGERLTDVLPATGTHSAMTESEISLMFPGLPADLFREHDWLDGVTDIGTVPASTVSDLSNGVLDVAWTAQIDDLLAARKHDLVLSIGQVVPHEVMGMAGYNKNVLIGAGGHSTIHKTHYLSAVYGIERTLGRIDNPMKRLLNYASDHYLESWPIVYVLTVLSRDATGQLKIRGLFIGDDETCFINAARLSLEINVELLDAPLEKVVVYLDPGEFRSTWLGNKSVYRTRLAIKDGGQLIVLAPGLREFGEHHEMDRLIRKYGYIGNAKILAAVKENDDLQQGLSAAAHLIHGSSEERFSITYCPGNLTADEINSVNYEYAELAPMLERYNPEIMTEGFNTLPDGEPVYFIHNPAVGLWAYRERF